MLKDVAVDYGETLHLTCPVYVSDDLVVTEWYKDGRLIGIKFGIHFTIVSQHKDDGMYQCVAVQGGQRISSNVIRVKIKGTYSSYWSYCNTVFCSCC